MEQRFELFTALIAGLSRAIRKIKSEEMVEFHLKGPHVSCLYYLYKQGELTAKELCDLCEEDKANMSRTIDFLERNGYVLCATKSRHRYRAPLSLTEQGNVIGRHIAERIDRVLMAAGEGVSEEERCAMYDILSRIHTNLQKVCDAYDEKKKTRG